MNIFFWDIDGTLIRTAKAGLYAFEQAMQELWGGSIDWSQITTAGMTDYYIAARAIEVLTDRPASEAEAVALSTRYEELLLTHLSMREGKTMPSVREILEYLAQRNDCRSLLLTGNSRTGSEIKLKQYDLAQFFDYDNSAFCERSYHRDDIAGCARGVAQRFAGDKPPKVFVIGDTPNDVRCGQAIGAYTVAVATGAYSLEELSDCRPWWAVQALPDSGAFWQKIQEAENL